MAPHCAFDRTPRNRGLGDIGAGQRLDDCAVAHDMNDIAKVLRLGGHNNHSGAVRGEFTDQLIHLLRSADVNSLSWFVEQKNVSSAEEPARNYHLLLVAAAKGPNSRVSSAREWSQREDDSMNEVENHNDRAVGTRCLEGCQRSGFSSQLLDARLLSGGLELLPARQS